MKVADWKDLPCSWISRINIVKMIILPKAIYRFNANTIPIKILTQFFIDLERPIFNFIWKNKNLRIAKILLNNARSSRGIPIPDFKLYYRAVIIKNTCYCHKDRHIDQWNQTEDPDINPHNYGKQIFDKIRNIQWKKRKHLQQMVLVWCHHVEECK